MQRLRRRPRSRWTEAPTILRHRSLNRTSDDSSSSSNSNNNHIISISILIVILVISYIKPMVGRHRDCITRSMRRATTQRSRAPSRSPTDL